MSTPGSYLVDCREEDQSTIIDLISKGEPSNGPITNRENNPDIFITTGEDLTIGIATIRDIIIFLQTKPLSGQKQVIIPSAEKLTEEAQNALLKTLEEPPDYAAIYLLTQAPDLLLTTVRSRLMTLELTPGHESNNQNMKSQPEEIFAEWSVKQRLTQAANIGSDRKAALALVDGKIIDLQAGLVSSSLNEQIINRLRLLLKIKSYLKANTNVRLTLENLFLNW